MKFLLLGILVFTSCKSEAPTKPAEPPKYTHVKELSTTYQTPSQKRLSVSLGVELKARPQTNSPLLSDWDIRGKKRSWELGVDPLQRPYLTISSDGKRSRMVMGNRSIPLNHPVRLSAEFVGGKEIRLLINDELVREAKDKIPRRLHESGNPVLVGKRKDSKNAIDALVADVQIAEAVTPSNQLQTKPLPPLAQTRFLPEKDLSGYFWFGYYDKMQLDAGGNRLLALRGEPGTENKQPRPEDSKEVGYFDLGTGEWKAVGETKAWNWQQGSMLQWRPGHPDQILFNDREDTPTPRFVTRLIDLKSGESRTLPAPIYHVSSDGKWAVGTDFARIEDTRRGYGYAGISDPNADDNAPESSTIYRLDLETGEVRDLVTLAQILDFGKRVGEGKKHYFNHLQINPSGTRIMFLHRWRDRSIRSRVFTIGADGEDLKLVSDYAQLSHYVWRTDQELVIYMGPPNGYATFKEDGSRPKPFMRFGDNGHQSFLPSNPDIMISDTYPKDNFLTLFSYNAKTDEARVLQVFERTSGFTGEFRVDLHPRVTDKFVIVDTSQNGRRQQAIVTLPF